MVTSFVLNVKVQRHTSNSTIIHITCIEKGGDESVICSEWKANSCSSKNAATQERSFWLLNWYHYCPPAWALALAVAVPPPWALALALATAFPPPWAFAFALALASDDGCLGTQQEPLKSICINNTMSFVNEQDMLTAITNSGKIVIWRTLIIGVRWSRTIVAFAILFNYWARFISDNKTKQ